MGTMPHGAAVVKLKKMLTTEATPAPTEAVQETKVVYTTAGTLEQTLKDEVPEAFFRENKIRFQEYQHEGHSIPQAKVTISTADGYIYLPWMDAAATCIVEVKAATTSITTHKWYLILTLTGGYSISFY
jgi:hypothetical protein